MTRVEASNLPSKKLTPPPVPPFLLYLSHVLLHTCHSLNGSPCQRRLLIENVYNYCHTLSTFSKLFFTENKKNIKCSFFSMRSVLLRTGSGSILIQTPVIPRSVSSHESIGKVFNGEKKKGCSSPVISLNLEANRRGIRRASSESDVIRSAFEGLSVNRTLSKIGSSSLPAIIPEEDCGSVLNESEVLIEDRQSYAGDWPRNGIPELGFPGGGIGKNRKFGGSGDGRDEYNADSFTSGNSDPEKIGAYYKEMLNSDPMNPLFLRNYGKYLHEVERDFVKAEECYGRAILASPGDGEVLALYGKLVWETQRDESRAKSYFDQAIHASPDDSTVLGSYAHFMWEAAEEDEETEAIATGASTVAAY